MKMLLDATCSQAIVRHYPPSIHAWLQVHKDALDSTVANVEATGLQSGDMLPRSGERVSLTVRRVPRVLAALRL